MAYLLRKLYASVFFWVCALCMHGQNPVAIRYTVDDGLPSNEVYDAFEDDEGNVWFATDHGISRFDGYRFENFSREDGLACNTIFEFEQDMAGRVWMRGLDGSLSILYQGQIFPYPYNEKLKSCLKGKFINTMVCGSNDRMYVTLAPSLPQTYVIDLATGELDTLWLSGGFNTAILNVGRLEKPAVVINPVAATAWEQPPQGVGDSSRATCWMVDYDPIKKFQSTRALAAEHAPDTLIAIVAEQVFCIAGGQVSPPQPLAHGFHAITRDRDAQIWISTRQGLQEINPDGSMGANIFPQETVFGLLHDSHRSYWVCTQTGVLLVRNMAHRVYDQIGGEPLRNVKRMRCSNSKLYMLCGHDSILEAEMKQEGLTWATKRFSLNPMHANHDFLILPQWGRLITGGTAFDINSGQVAKFWPQKGFPAWQFRLHGEHVLIAGGYSYNIFDLRRGLLLPLKLNEKITRIYTSILEDRRGAVWMGATDGLFRLRGEQPIPYRQDRPLFRERVTDLVDLGNGIVVVATRGAGIYAFDQDHLWHMREAQGLISDMCNRLYLGPSGLWICTNRGLSLLCSYRDSVSGASQGALLNYNLLDGLPTNKVNDVLEHDGKAYIATDLGLVTISAASLGAARMFPTTKITHLFADGRAVKMGGPLTADEDNLEFRFQGRLLPALGNVQYRYRLVGYDDAWRTSEGRNAFYYDLPPGKYTFEVVAIYPYATHNPNVARWEVEMPPKLHENLWIQLLVSLGLTFLIGLAIGLMMRSRYRRTATNLSRLQAEIKALRSQMRPHFIFNALNSIQHLIKLQDHETAEAHLLGFSKLMRAILEASNHETISVSKEAEILQAYLELEKLRFDPAFDYYIEMQAGVDWENCQIPPMLLQPILENAVWHGLRLRADAPKLWLRFRQPIDGGIYIEIEDNGIGRKAAAQIARKHLGPSMALQNIQERIRLINATRRDSISLAIDDLEDDQGQSQGTLVRLCLPKSNHASRKH